MEAFNSLPHSLTKKYKDMYLEMDVEMLTPDKEHSIGVNEYSQNRNALSYKYRRGITCNNACESFRQT